MLWYAQGKRRAISGPADSLRGPACNLISHICSVQKLPQRSHPLLKQAPWKTLQLSVSICKKIKKTKNGVRQTKWEMKSKEKKKWKKERERRRKKNTHSNRCLFLREGSSWCSGANLRSNRPRCCSLTLNHWTKGQEDGVSRSATDRRSTHSQIHGVATREHTSPQQACWKREAGVFVSWRN